MAMNPKEWQFVFAAIEEAGRALYARGYADRNAGKLIPAEPNRIVLTKADKMRLQALYNQTFKQGH